MNVAIDLTALMPEGTGVDRYLLGLARHVGQVDRRIRYTVFVNAGDRGRLGDPGPNVTIRPCCVRSRPARLLFQQCGLPLATAFNRYDVVHSPSFLMPAWRGRSRHLLAVHDLTFFSMPDVHNRLRRSRAFRAAVAASIRRAHMLHVPSLTTRGDLRRLFPDVPAGRTCVIPYGVEARFTPACPDDTARRVERFGLTRPYVLHVGTIEPRKNILTLVDAYLRLVRAGDAPADLVLTGTFGWNSSDVRTALDASELRGRVHVTGHVPDDDLPWLYRGASLFVFPSRFEGFGFPPLEAMACGVPVIASKASALEENLAGAAELVAPGDVPALAAAMQRLLADAERRRDLARRGLERAAAFTWDLTAVRTVETYRQLATGAL